MQQIFLQNTTAILLQNEQKFITKCVKFFIAKRDSFNTVCKPLLQNASILLQNGTVITNCAVYYKMRLYSAT